jgi:LPS sulfotransferase NodH
VTDFPGFFRRLLREGTGANCVFGSKLMQDQATAVVSELAALLGRPEADPPGVLQAAFPNLRYIWLRRLDKIRQGISFYRALRTGRWRSTDLAGVPPVAPPFDFAAIQSLVQLSVWADEDWDDFFRRYAIAPLRVTYEELAVAPEAVVRHIIDHLGLRPPARLRPDVWQHQRQADALTDAWVAQYEACDRARRTSSARHAGSA